jgi:FMN phosphatase YigB (HAD superfamily)
MATVISGRPEAVLWDMDGTLVDTEPYWIDREFALAEKYGGTWTQEHAMVVVAGWSRKGCHGVQVPSTSWRSCARTGSPVCW